MNPMNMAGMSAMGGGPVGGMSMMNNGAGPAGRNEGDKQDDFRNQLNTYIYDYFLKSGYHDCARALVHHDVPIKTKGPGKTSPGHREDMNGLDDNAMDTDSKEDMKWPEDLPRPDVPPEVTPTNSFLFDWFCLFTDIFRAQRRQGRTDSAAAQYLHHTQVWCILRDIVNFLVDGDLRVCNVCARKHRKPFSNNLEWVRVQ
jgi:hypothetical protein